MLYNLENLIECATECQRCINEKWVPARPLQHSSFFVRVKTVWHVFIGKYDVVRWPENQ